MIFFRRVSTVYRKELKDILRDRRTLIAMIVVPIVLYPLLMVGSIQAVSFQAESLQTEKLMLGVIRDTHRDSLTDLIRHDAEHLDREKSLSTPAGDTRTVRPTSIDLTEARVAVFERRDALEDAIRNRQIQAGVIFEPDELVNALDRQNHIQIPADLEEVRSASAARRLQEMIQRVGRQSAFARLDQIGLPRTLFEPFTVTLVNLASPPSILGQILPLILVLMTVTGAIYPAIDLTAGERERGTLESVMVCPIPVFDLIVGKFLVVTTIAILGAALNLASVSATVYFGGFHQLVAKSEGGIPIAKMLFVLLALVPFAVLMSAIMIAVCSFARTFKEAQNYVTPVILAVLIPGGFAAFPTARLEGIHLVMPVANMVLLAREVLLGATVPGWQVATVLLSTTLYAAAAVAIATNLFGQEAVLFSDVASLKTTLSRKIIRPRSKPTVSTALLLVALLFPAWFFVQSALNPAEGEDPSRLFFGTAIFMPIMFVLLPAAVLAYARIDVTETLNLKTPSLRYLVAALFLGATAWIPLHELTLLQQLVFPIPAGLADQFKKMEEALRRLDPAQAILLVALVPAVCEELLFRGLLLSGLTTATRWGVALLVSAVIFGIFHFLAFRFVPTFAMGLLLGFLCLRARSIVPCILAHFLHNALVAATLYWPWRSWIGMPAVETASHLPGAVLGIGGILFAIGLVLTSKRVEVRGANRSAPR